MQAKKKDPKTLAFEIELNQLLVKYGFLTPTVRPQSIIVSTSVMENPVISIVAIGKD